MNERQCSTQAELDAALKAGDKPVLIGNGHFVLRGNARAVLCGSSSAVLCGSSSAVLWGSSSAVLCGSSSAVLWGSSSAVLWGSSSAVLWESSHAVLWESSSAVLWGSSSAVLWESSSAKASKFVALQIHSSACKVVGGVQIRIVKPKTAVQWCSFYGVPIKKGVAILFKAVTDEWKANHNGFLYTPKSTPVAPDWDNGFNECGGGLHFSPCPSMAKDFHESATKFVACPVRVKDCRAPKESDHYPNKIKAKGCCAPVWECDIHGVPVK